jgi:hypothetical protein
MQFKITQFQTYVIWKKLKKKDITTLSNTHQSPPWRNESAMRRRWWRNTVG